MIKVAKFEKVSFHIFNENKIENIKQVYDQIKLPKRATKYSAGYDFYLPYDVEIKPNESVLIPTGIKVKIESNYFLMICPRSSLGFKFKLQLNNTIGIIDADYYYSKNEGHIFIKLFNDNKENKTVCLKQNEAFAQGIFLNYGITIDDETETIRDGGIGSTNKNV